MKSTKVKVFVAVVVLVAVAVGVGIYLFLRDDAPGEGSKDKALEGAKTTEERDGIEGDWSVEPQEGDWTWDVETGTFAGFRITEELQGVGSTTAVGRTGEVEGTITIEGSTVTGGTFEVDLTSIETDRDMRNRRVQDALNTGEFPTGTFTLTAPIELGDGAADGAEVSVTATGDLTIAGVTKSVELEVDAQLEKSVIGLYATTDITFSDFGVEVPSAPIVLSAEDHGTLELQLVLVPAGG